MATSGVRLTAWAGILGIVAVAGLGALQAQFQTLPADSPAQGWMETQGFFVGTIPGALMLLVVGLAVVGFVYGAVGGWLRVRDSGGMSR